MTSEMPEEDRPLKLEVGQTYEDNIGDLIDILAERDGVFVGIDEENRASTYNSDGQYVDAVCHIISKHTPPPEVKPVWVVVDAEGNRALRSNAESAASQAEHWDNIGKGPCDAQRIDLTYQGGRRDDLRDKEAGK